MAKPFAERLATALKTNAQTVENLRDLIAETETERERQLKQQRLSEADAVDVLLNPGEQDAAAVQADRSRRMAQGYADALEKLREKLQIKLASETRKAAEAERAAALAEREEIAARFGEEVPKALAVLTGLFRDVQANAARMKEAGVHERDAEAEARDIAGNFTHGPTPVDSFVKMKIPAWSGPGRSWPLEPRVAELARIQEQERRERVEYQQTRSPAAIRAAEEAKYPSYVVSHSKKALALIEHRGGYSSLEPDVKRTLRLNERQVDEARAAGFTVEPVDARVVA